MSDDKRILDELRGAVTDMAVVVDVLVECMPGHEFHRVRDRLIGLQSHVAAANKLANAAHQPAKEPSR